MANPTRPLVFHVPTTEVDQAAKEAWVLICENIRSNMPQQAYQTWFVPIKPLRFEDHTLTVEVPSRFYYDWIEGHYASHIERALDETLGNSGMLAYFISPPSGNGEKVLPPQPVRAVKPGRRLQKPTAHGLNSRYLFDNFIEGPANSFARAAAVAVSRSPGKTAYNPLLVYGGVGLGKTHLQQAIGNECLRLNPQLTVRYVSSEKFTQEFVDAIRNNRAMDFSTKYQSVDVLLLDDIQFLMARDRTQMEFFHTFNALHQAGKQIVLTSDKPPRDLGGLDERLISRIGWGLVCDIGPPDYETRLAIIQRFAEEEKTELDPEVCKFLAQYITKNVRQIQGALIRVFAHSNLHGEDITLDLARRALRDLYDTSERKVSVDMIRSIVAQTYRVPPDLLSAKTRTQPIARTRMIAMALTAQLTGLSLKQVGRHYGNRDHTTVLHAREKVSLWEKEDKSFAEELREVIHKIETAAD